MEATKEATHGGALRVLVVDDQPIVIEALRRMLADEADTVFTGCSAAAAALETALAFGPTVILQDLVMPDGDGFALLERYTATVALHGVPVVVLSSKEDPRDKSRAFALGASDYLVKVPDRIELVARVRAHSRSFVARRERDAAFAELERLKAQLEAQNVELARLSIADGLTGLANRRRFDEVLDAELRRAVRDGSELSLILADVDHFKRFNDHYGHLGGDGCLTQVAGAMRAAVKRPADLVARYGGEEFAVILPSTPLAGAGQVADAIRLLVADLGLAHEASDVAPYVTLSLGVASCWPGRSDAGTAVARLIEAADRALYAAKRDGRNRVAVAEGGAADASG